ncbi:uncharacterized protein LOC119342889, partial [Triticum dicoccoides]|uniref:uncharacterized protein LOC119342889 n=1 Tax=Triticum dicoccoides TaxID=85692 RepID=UPI00188EBDC3
MEPPPSQQNITRGWSMDCQCYSKGADLHLPVSLNKMDQRVVTMCSARSASRWPSNCCCYYCSTCAVSGADAACCLPLELARELLLAVRASFLRQKHQAVIAMRMLWENRDMFDLVISDVHMPDMDGFKLLELVGLEMHLLVI